MQQKEVTEAVMGCGNVSQGHIRGWLVDLGEGFAEERLGRFEL